MVTIKIKNDQITGALTRLSAEMADMTKPMTRVGEYLVVSTKDRFKEGASPAGAKWAPKSPATLAASGARKSNSMDIRPLFGESKSLSTLFSYSARPDGLEFGSPMVYAAVQQFGAAAGSLGFYSGTDKNGRSYDGVSPWGNIPARPFIGISTKDETNIVAILAKWAQDASAAGGA